MHQVTAYLISTPGHILMAVLATLFLYVVFRKKDELGREAVLNIAATVVISAANIGASLLFANDLNAFAQSAYDALHIPTLDPAVWTHVPVWVGGLAALIARDFADYWNHRLMHTRLGWLTHAAHHSDTHVNAFTTFRVHILESILMSASYVVLLTWAQLPHLIPVMVVLTMAHNIYVHMDLNITHGPFRYLLASPVFHRWHHADVPEAYGKNLANVIPPFDLMFGTYYMPGPCKAPMGAQSAGIPGTDPVAIYLYPILHPLRPLIAAAKVRLMPRAVAR